MGKKIYNPYVEDLKSFIEHNELTFEGGCSSRNSDLVILCGYSLHVGAEKEDIETILKENFKVDANIEKEFNSVYSYAKKNNYGDWWNNPKNAAAVNAYTPD